MKHLTVWQAAVVGMHSGDRRLVLLLRAVLEVMYNPIRHLVLLSGLFGPTVTETSPRGTGPPNLLSGRPCLTRPPRLEDDGKEAT
jgi:hypothetical protein